MLSKYLKGNGLIATLLLVFLIVVGIAIWFLDLLAQQRTFAFLLSGELIAFAMLVYLYYKEDSKQLSRRWLFSGLIALAIVILLGVTALL
jgi:hypothetical protein